MSLPRIAITMGDPAGIGPELCLRAIGDPGVRGNCHPLVYGNAAILQQVADRLGLELGCPVATPGSPELMSAAGPTIVDVHVGSLAAIEPGRPTAESGSASFSFVNAAIDDALAGVVAGVATAPIHKEAWAAAGIPYPGHTELFGERCRAERFCMMMTAPRLSCSLVTTHIGLADVATALSRERILDVIELTAAALKRIHRRPPRLAVLGLNPHAGEQGLFGNREEEEVIEPAMEAARQRGILLEGPWPADTAFLPWRLDEIDGYICMYHDQGLIPFKTLAFETGVNTTLGLPVIRTSVDHGTAMDIAWKGTADPASLFAAIQLAATLAESP